MENLMSFTKDDINKLAHLARLPDVRKSCSKLEPEKLELFENKIIHDLDNILDMINQIVIVNTDDIQPMAHPITTNQTLRPDDITETDARTEMQALASNRGTRNGLYLVPRAVE